jgi:hypothetical protein
VSHPTPLHPDADLAVVLDDMRQSVAAWGDEGMVARFFRASICLMLLSILDTLLELLADFRAGRLPPILPARDEPEDRRTIPPPAREVSASPRRLASCHIRPPVAAFANDPCDGAADAPGERTALAQRRPCFCVAASRPPIDRRENGPRRVAGYPSHVPRSPFHSFGGKAPPISHVYFVAKSKRLAIRFQRRRAGP